MENAFPILFTNYDIDFSVSVRHQLNFSANGSGKLDITVSPKNAMGRTVSCRLFSL